jgi:hypothetical protein
MLSARPVCRRRAPVLLVLFTTSVGLAWGCASASKEALDLRTLQNKSEVFVTHRGRPTFSISDQRREAMTSAAAGAGGILGALVAMAVMKGVGDGGAGLEKLVTIDLVADRLEQRLVTRLQSEPTASGVRWTAAGPGGSRTVDAPSLEFELKRWGIKSHDDDWDAFFARVEGVAKVSMGEEILWEAECEPPLAPGMFPLPTMAELREDRERLPRMMTTAAEACADDLVARLLNPTAAASERPEKRELTLERTTLEEVRAVLFGRDTLPGLVVGPARFEARFQGVQLDPGRLGALQELVREAMAAPPGSEVRVQGTIEGRRFETRMERNRAGRVRVKFSGLRFSRAGDVDQFLAPFIRPGIRRVEFDGEAEGLPLKK